MKIRFCENNEGSAAIFKRLRAAHPEGDIMREKCVKNCAACSSALFAVVDGNCLRSRTPEELFLEISALLKTG